MRDLAGRLTETSNAHSPNSGKTSTRIDKSWFQTDDLHKDEKDFQNFIFDQSIFRIVEKTVETYKMNSSENKSWDRKRWRKV